MEVEKGDVQREREGKRGRRRLGEEKEMGEGEEK